MTEVHIPKIVPKKGDLLPQLKRSGYILFHFPAWIYRLCRDTRIQPRIRTRLMLCSAYMILPISLISKKKWGWLGYTDDLLLAVNTLDLVFRDVPKDIQKELWNGSRSDLEILEEWVIAANDFLDEIPGKILEVVKDFKKGKTSK